MSNEWSAPSSQPVPPPPPGTTDAPTEVTLEPVGPKTPPTKKRSTAKIVAAVATVVVVGGAGTFAAARIAGDDDPQGAESPEELGELALDAFEQTDVLGAMDLLLPDERETYGEPMIELIDELERIEVLSDVDLTDINGVDVELTNRDVTVEETEVDDIVHLTLTADATTAVVADELPTGPILDENEIRGEDSESSEVLDVPLVGVQRDGEWYLSMMYTAAEAIRVETVDPDTGEAPPIPAEGVTPKGADSPEGALELLAEAAEDLDVEAIIAGINPREADALQRYAPIFLDDAQEELDDVESTVEFTELDTRVEGGGSTREVFIEDLGVTIDSQGEVVEILWTDGCLVVEAEGDRVDLCNPEDFVGADTDELLEEMYAELDDPEPVKRFIEAFTETFADFEAPGISVTEVDGEWFVSPVATGTAYVLAVSGALDSEELRDLIDLGEEAIESLENDTFDIED
jgi:hypothetical protein